MMYENRSPCKPESNTDATVGSIVETIKGLKAVDLHPYLLKAEDGRQFFVMHGRLCTIAQGRLQPPPYEVERSSGTPE